MATRRHRSLRTLIAGSLIAGSVALITPGSPVQAAPITVTIVDEDGNPIERAFIAVGNSSRVALEAAITGADGTAVLENTGVAGYVVSAPGFETVGTLSSLSSDTTIELTRAPSIGIGAVNTYGAQLRRVAADAESGVFYATTDGSPSVWRTTDYAGTWSPVPTVAFADDGVPQRTADSIATSGVAGEVAVTFGNEVWFSRDYGTTWTQVGGFPTNVGNAFGQNGPKIMWAHAGTTSYLFIHDATGANLHGAAIPTDGSSTSAPQFVAMSQSEVGAGLYSVAPGTGNTIHFAVAKGDGTDTKVYSFSGTGSPASIVFGTAEATGVTLASGRVSSGDVLQIKALGSARTTRALLLYDTDGSNTAATGDLTLAHHDGTSWTTSNGLVGPSSQNQQGLSPWTTTYTGLKGSGGSDANRVDWCGENGTGAVADIAPASGAGDFAGFEVVAAVRSCFVAFNASGGAVDYASQSGASVGDRKIAITYMTGAGNNSGNAFDAGFDFDTNTVVLSGGGSFGVRKSVGLGATKGYRPNYGQPGVREANQVITALAKPGSSAGSDGIAVVGMNAPVVRDIAFSPNDTTGDTYVVATSSTGGSRILLTTDGGESFSTVGGGGGQSIDWWNAAGDTQMIATFYSLSDINGELRVKSFSGATGTGATEMGEELAASGTDREDPTKNLGFQFSASSGIANLLSGMITPGAGNSAEMSVVTGVTGTNFVLLGASETTGGGGSVDAEFAGGTVALVELQPANGAATASAPLYFGKNATLATGDAASGGATFSNGGITAITYCPPGSADPVEDTAFISVKNTSRTSASTADDGIYKISDVTGTPTYSATGAAFGFRDMKVDCDTGIVVGIRNDAASGGQPSATDGLYLSLDGDSFVRAALAAPVNQPSSIAVQADAAAGTIDIVVAGGSGDIVAIDATEGELGIDLDAVAAGSVQTPGSPVQIPNTAVETINSSQNGINTGSVSDVEIPKDENDFTDVDSSGNATRAGNRGLRLRALENDAPVAIGAGSGAFSTAVGSTSTGGGGAGGPTFEPLTPARILDTRSGVGATAGKVGKIDGSGAALELSVAGKGGLPASGIGAVALNVTVVDGQANDFGGYVTVYPCGTRPDASNLNFVTGQTIPNSVIAPVSSTGTVCFYVYGNAHLLADVSGYLPSGFTPLTPARVLDTRSGVGATAGKVGKIDGSGAALELTVAGKGGLPASGVDAVALNVTVVDGQANDFGGYVTVYPCGTRPDASNLNFVTGQTIPNSVIAPVSSSGTVCFYVYGNAHLLADVSGYFASGFSQLTPARVLDTRSGVGATAGKVGKIDGTGAALELTVAGKGGLPASGIGAVALNVTVVDGQANDFGGYVTVYPCGTRPDASNLNFVSGQTIPNSVIAPVSSSGKVCFYVYGNAHLLADVSGYFAG